MKQRKLIGVVATVAIAAAALAVYTNCSVVSDGAEHSFFPAISSDGTRIAYWVGDPNDCLNVHSKIVLYDSAGMGSRTTVSDNLTRCGRPSISRDGKYVGFMAAVDGNDNIVWPYVYDVQNSTLLRCTYLDNALTPYVSNRLYVSYNMWPPAISDEVDGNSSKPYVAFERTSAGPMPWDPPIAEIRVWNLGTASYAASGGEPGTQPCIDAAATKVGFISSSGSLLSNSGYVQQVFLSTSANHTTWTVAEVVSKSTAGTLGNAASSQPSMCSDGSRIAFVSTASNLTSPAGTSGYGSLYLRDRSGSGTTTLRYDNDQSLSSTFGSDALMPSISPDGGWIAFMVGEAPTSSTFGSEAGISPPTTISGPTPVLLDLSGSSTEAIAYYHGDTTTFHCRNGNLVSLGNNGAAVAFDSPGANVCSGYSTAYDRVYRKWGR